MSTTHGDVYFRTRLQATGETVKSSYLVVLCDGPSGDESVYTALTTAPHLPLNEGCHLAHPASYRVPKNETPLEGEARVMIDQIHLVDALALTEHCEHVGRLESPVTRRILECASECPTLSGYERRHLQAAADLLDD